MRGSHCQVGISCVCGSEWGTRIGSYCQYTLDDSVLHRDARFSLSNPLVSEGVPSKSISVHLCICASTQRRTRIYPRFGVHLCIFRCTNAQVVHWLNLVLNRSRLEDVWKKKEEKKKRRLVSSPTQSQHWSVVLLRIQSYRPRMLPTSVR